MPIPEYFHDESTHDELFATLNKDSNPLSSEHWQNWIRENEVGHTSMSIGDMIYDGKNYFVCLTEGWSEVAWINYEHAPNQ